MTILQRPIYLHLFDRELWESVGQKPNRSSIDRALKSLIVGSSAPLYCGLSLVWENPALRSANNQIDPIILKLIELGVIEPISQYPTVEEFIHTRRDVYKHDQSRYPLYFRLQCRHWTTPSAHQVVECDPTSIFVFVRLVATKPPTPLI